MDKMASKLTHQPTSSAALEPLIASGLHGVPPAAEKSYAQLRQHLVSYLKPEDLVLIDQAFIFSVDAHHGQFRSSGDHYISHPIAVANTLAEWKLDAQALIAALLHDVVEDTHVTQEEIAQRFGPVAADLVDGVSKLDQVENQTYAEAQAENFSKMLLAMARDVRVIIVKLADRLHNMRTLNAVDLQKRKRIARETMDIYAPIANRLGLDAIYRELQELSFTYLMPMRYRVLAKALRAARGNRRAVVDKILTALQTCMSAHDWNINAEIVGREKHLYSIYRKMRSKQLSFSQIYDIFGFRVIVKDIPNCYMALGALHGLYEPLPGKFKDYIAIPKRNHYQSIHTTLIGPFDLPIEVQIRTQEMNNIAEQGIASHWLYKDQHSLSELQKNTHRWLQSLLELQQASNSSTEFLENVKVDLFPDEVYVFTPRGKILTLPRGATAVDFAFAVHSDIGNRCVSCRINDEAVPLRTELHNGDRIEIIAAPHANPNPSWLSYVRTAKARAAIRQFIRARQNTTSIELGKRLLLQALLPYQTKIKDISDAAWAHFLHDHQIITREKVYSEIGLARLTPLATARSLLAADPALESRLHTPTAVNGNLTHENATDKNHENHNIVASNQQVAPRSFAVKLTSNTSQQQPLANAEAPAYPVASLAHRTYAHSKKKYSAWPVLPIQVHGSNGVPAQLGTCCRPIPGDPIVGSISNDKSLEVHLVECRVISRSPQSFIEVEWGNDIEGSYETAITIVALNKPGSLSKIASAISSANANIIEINMDSDRSSAVTMYLTILVSTRLHLAQIMRQLRLVTEVIRITRRIQ